MTSISAIADRFAYRPNLLDRDRIDDQFATIEIVERNRAFANADRVGQPERSLPLGTCSRSRANARGNLDRERGTIH
jgi:hypothetical protein